MAADTAADMAAVQSDSLTQDPMPTEGATSDVEQGQQTATAREPIAKEEVGEANRRPSQSSTRAHFPIEERRRADLNTHGSHDTAQDPTEGEDGKGTRVEGPLGGGGDDGKSREEGPACLINFRDRVEACSHRVQAWADEKEVKARERKVRKRDETDGGVRVEPDGTVVEPKGDGIVQRKGIIVLVAVILSWVYIVFVWRICGDAIRRESRATATRSEGIGLLVGFNVLWLMTIWSYIKVICTGPGYVRDHTPMSEPPPSPKDDSFQFPASTSAPTMAPPAPALPSNAQGNVPAHSKEESVDSSFAAALGPVGVSLVARANEEARARDGAATGSVAPAQSQIASDAQETLAPQHDVQPADFNQKGSSFPEPMRLPQTAKPLHPTNTYCYRCRRHKPPRAHHCRHCGTCVLKMDHHCPWVGGCVGARNHKFFYHFLQWVTLLELFVLIVNAVLFRRGILRRSRPGGWSIDGYMISLLPISAVFTIFTTALLITHTYTFVVNLTTIEHMGYERQKTREDILIDRWLEDRSKHQGTSKPSWFQQVRERKAMKAKWSQFWGKPKTEANPFWLDGRGPVSLVSLQPSSGVQSKAGQSIVDHDLTKSLSWWQAVGPNWRQAMGDNVLGWILPIGRARNADGLAYEGNWRFGPLGEWTPRQQWTSRLSSSE